MYCLKCVPFSCENTEGLISLEWSTRGSVQYIDDKCTLPPGYDSGYTNNKDSYITGPVIGTVAVQAYAFKKGTDKWLGSRCMGEANASQSFIQKYDGITERYYLFPTKNNTGQITGDLDESIISLGEEKCETITYRSILMNGATVSTEMGTIIGGNLSYNGYPISFEMPITEKAFEIFDQMCFLTGFSVNVDFPSPAVANYNFQFILDCEEGDTGPNPPIANPSPSRPIRIV